MAIWGYITYNSINNINYKQSDLLSTRTFRTKGRIGLSIISQTHAVSATNVKAHIFIPREKRRVIISRLSIYTV